MDYHPWRWYDRGMKVKTSVSLSRETIRVVDSMSGRDSNRSRVIEEAVRFLAAARIRRGRENRDRVILDRVSVDLNAEMSDVLRYQSRV